MRRNLLPRYGEVGLHVRAVHIIMGRTNARALDVYAEIGTDDAWDSIFKLYEEASYYGEPLKMGVRHVNIEKSSQSELMKEIFPLSCCMDFKNSFGIPVKVKNDDVYSTGFKKFLKVEELHLLLRSVIDPERVSCMTQFGTYLTDHLPQHPHGGKNAQRPFEYMMTILHKVRCPSSNLRRYR
jgi:hypothetical protein